MDFDRPLNALIGGNGQGKTNFLEAVFFLSYLRSFRAVSIRETRRFGAEGFSLAAEVDNFRGRRERLEIEINDKRRLKIDGVPVRRSTDFVCRLNAVVFQHEDLSLVTGGASERRRFLDILLSSLRPAYLSALRDYATALKYRNAILRRPGRPDTRSLAAYEPIMAENAEKIVAERENAIQSLDRSFSRLSEEIRGKDYRSNLRYVPRARGADREEYARKLAAAREQDIRGRYSSVGPHLDDFDFFLNGVKMRRFASLGQCRLAALCLKMAAIDVIIENGGQENTVALVDDVTGELDDHSRTAFFRVIAKARQAFFTLTRPPKEDFFKGAGWFSVKDSQILKEKGD